MVIRRKQIKDLRDIGRDLDNYINQYTYEIAKEYEQSWSRKGWGVGVSQIDKLRHYISTKISAELVLRVDFNYPEFDRLLQMTPGDIRRAKESEKEKKRCPGCGLLVRPGSKHGAIQTDFKTYGKQIDCKYSGKVF